MGTESRCTCAKGGTSEIDLIDILGEIVFRSYNPAVMVAGACCCFTKTSATTDN
jgi:hypothetical protein